MDYDEEMFGDDDDEYDQHYEDEYTASPSDTSYLYQRTRLTSTNQTVANAPRLFEFIPDDKPAAVENTFNFDDDSPIDEVDVPPPPGFAPISKPPTRPSSSASTARDPVKAAGFSISRIETPEPRVVENLRARALMRENWEAPKGLTPNASSHRLNQLASILAAPSTPRRERKRAEGKELINLVVVGHVDAGKSTMMGHLLCKLDCVDQRVMHKYRQESERLGKGSFAFAWVLDETEEERARGVTMDIARTSFETEHRRIVLLDAPGHKDFIPNMITGASQADAALLVVNANIGEFESGFDKGGQTREHSMLIRSLGVSQLIVAINQMDKVNWSADRYKEVESQIRVFLERQAGFSKITVVPCSGLAGENLTERVKPGSLLHKWYDGPCLLELIDRLKAPARASDGPLRAIINDIFKATTSQLSVSVKIESGDVEANDEVYIMPTANTAFVKAVSMEGSSAASGAFTGSQALMTLNGQFEPDTIHPGHVLTSRGKDALMPGRTFKARIVVFDIAVPIMKGTKAELYCHSLCEPVTFKKLVSEINKTNGEVLKDRPRCLAKNRSGVVILETEHEVAVEPYTICKQLGRITIRCNNQTIAAGIIEAKVDIGDI
ncbi:unnamed protein product, partial [Mesorhabditis spiculigera]